MGVSFEAPRCSRHPGARAGWRCTGCGAHLCPGCAYLARSGPAVYPACTRCRGIAEVITAPRSTLEPFPGRLVRALAYPFTLGTITAVVGTAIGAYVLSYFPFVGWLISAGVRWAFIFAIIRQASRGATHFEVPDLGDIADYFVPAVRGLVATAIVWVPAALWFVMRLSAAEGPPSLDAALTDPVLWLLLLAGATYAPAALLHAAWGGGLLVMLNPVAVIRTAVQLGRDYLLAVAVVWGALVAGAVATGVAGRFAVAIPIVTPILLYALGLFGDALAAHVLGVLLHVRGDSVGLGVEDEYRVPVLGAATPRGVEPVLATTLAPQEPGTATALETPPSPAPASTVEGRMSAIVPVQPPPAAAPPPPLSVGADAIAAAVAAKDLARAASLYAELRDPTTPLPPRVLFQVARGASQAGSHELAAHVLHRAATAGDPAVAPDALLVLGRIYQSRLARPAEARQVFEHLVRQYPASTAAGHARAALARDGDAG